MTSTPSLTNFRGGRLPGWLILRSTASLNDLPETFAAMGWATAYEYSDDVIFTKDHR